MAVEYKSEKSNKAPDGWGYMLGKVDLEILERAVFRGWAPRIRMS